MTDTGPLKAELIAAIAATETLEQLEAVRLNALGKKRTYFHTVEGAG